MARPSLNPEQRAERRRQLLDAAHRLFGLRRELPTVAAIADSAGVSKGSVYLWFTSKEEIFIALLQDNFEQLMHGIAGLIADLPADAELAAMRFGAGLPLLLRQLPDLLPLAAMTNAVLEKNLPLEDILAFKQQLALGLSQEGGLLEARLTGLASGAGADLLLRSWALCMGLWQSLDYPDEVLPLLARAELQILARNFNDELRLSLCQLWRGALLARAGDPLLGPLT